MAKVSLRAYNRDIETMMDRGQMDEAVAHCHHILRKFPKHLETYRLLGKLYLELKRHADAVDIFTRVLNAEPNDFVAHVGMSIIRDEEDKLDDAIWHMERAFETQPSNAAIQSELQRLYGRREGVQPPRIRMTRGALAHMYVRGELYPQAISEIKGILADDGGRSDMQALLAIAYYRSGRKNDAANEATALLKRYPYCLDANRVMVEILRADRPDAVQIYRQRVVELDPYAGQVDGTVFQSGEVSDAAVSLERLEWDGQPSMMESDWGSMKAIHLESGETAEMTPALPPAPVPVPAFTDTTSVPAAPAEQLPGFMREAGWEPSTGTFDESKSVFSEEAETSSTGQPLEKGELPDWVRAMAPPEATQPPAEEQIPDWIDKIGTDELPIPSVESSAESQPDWLRQVEGLPAAQAPSSEETPDWLKSFEQAGEQSAIASASDESLDWLKGLGEEPAPAPAESMVTDRLEWMEPTVPPDEQVTVSFASEEMPDWLKGLDEKPEEAPAEVATEGPGLVEEIPQQEQPVPASVSDELPDWLKGLGEEPDETLVEAITAGLGLAEEVPQEEQPIPAPVSDEIPDWLKGLGEETREAPVEAVTEGPGLIEDAPREEQPIPTSVSDEIPDWLKGIGVEAESTPAAAKSDLPEWLSEIEPEPASVADQISSELDFLAPLGEELDTVPAESAPAEFDFLKEPEQPVVPASQPAMVDTGELGKSEQEREDSFAWLEALAAKQGATEGLLTKPEERLEKEPAWVEQVKRTTGQLVEQQPPEGMPSQVEVPAPEPVSFEQQPPEEVLPQVEEPASEPLPVEPLAVGLEDLGKSEQERDDSFAWLEALAAKQGATEGLLTKPEERLEEAPEWIRQAKDLGTAQPAPETAPVEETPLEPEALEPLASIGELGRSEQERDDSFAWLENLAAKQGVSEGLLTKPEERLEEEPDWVRQARESGVPPVSQETPVPSEEETQPSKPFSAVQETAEWLPVMEEEEVTPESVSSTDATLAWLKSLDEAEEISPVREPVGDLPEWLQSLDEENLPSVEPAVPAGEAEEPVAQPEVSIPMAEAEEELPSWLSELAEEQKKAPSAFGSDELPAWLRDETGELVAEPPKIEPIRTTDWHPIEETETPAAVTLPEPEPIPEPKPVSPPKEKKPAAKKTKPAPQPSGTYKEPMTIRGTGMLTMPVDPILESARTELSRSNIPGALDIYGKLIKKGRFLDEVVYDLREALYRYPVEVSIWQSLGDAYMRANRLQDALDAYTKAEELLR